MTEIRGFSSYKPIRNYIRKYSREELLEALIKLSCGISRSGAEVWSKGYVPWELLLLGRWIIRDWNNIKGTKKIDQNELNNILNKVKSFSDDDTFLKEGHSNGISKFMRRMAFQQFWFQTSVGYSNAGRSIDLLVNSTLSPEVDKKLLEATGISRKELYDIWVMVWASFSGERINSLLPSFFDKVKEKTGEGVIEAFFKNFSLDSKSIDSFNDTYKAKNYILEIYERSPFFYKPFYCAGGKYYLWNISILNEFLEYGIYDFLKKIIPDKFGDCFGPIFEKYLEKRLIEYSIPYVSENELRNQGFEKQVDYLLEEGKDVVLIESKAIEASRHVKLLPTDQAMSNAYKKDVVKGIAQAHYVFKKLTNEKDVQEGFLLIVTYKELFLGNGESVWDEFIEDTLNNKYGIENCSIKPENIFFLSADSYDKLLLCMDGDIKKLIEILKRIIQDKSKVETKKFVFSQYLSNLDLNTKSDEYLKNVFNDYYTKVIKDYFDLDLDTFN